jgi:hypothetical protein
MWLSSLDPGQALGWAVGSYDDTTPYTLHARGIWHGEPAELDELFSLMTDHGRRWIWGGQWAIERFIPRSNNFVANVSAVEREGALKYVLHDEAVTWRRASQKNDVPDRILHDHGLWQTGAMVDHSDGRDANDAIIHALGYLKQIRHVPTLRMYWGDSYEDGGIE